MKQELNYRQDKSYDEEKYYNHGQLDSIYRKWNAQGKKLTEGYYVRGKRHGKWWERISSYQSYHFLLYTYEYGILKRIYDYRGWIKKQDTIKAWEDFYNLEPDTSNFTAHLIKWDVEFPGKKSEEKTRIVRNKITIEEKRKVWDKGIPWKEEHTKALFDKQGKNLGHRKHGHWRLWNEDGTLQKETWYNMGHKLREKRYDHGKLVSDKKY